MYGHFTTFDKRKQQAILTACLPVKFDTPTIDKLTLLADLRHWEKTLQELQFHQDVIDIRPLPRDPNYSYYVETASDFQITVAHPSASVQHLRIEFNPNKCNPIDTVWHWLLPKMKNKRISRVDIAIDYQQDLSLWQPTTEKPRKMARWNAPNGQLETTNLGMRKSGNQYRIYDKRAEQIHNHIEPAHDIHWRIEQELRLDRGTEFWMIKPFADLILWRPDTFTGNYIDDLVLNDLYNNPDNWARLPPSRRRTYRRMIKDTSRVCHPPFHPVTTFQRGLSPLREFIEKLTE